MNLREKELQMYEAHGRLLALIAKHTHGCGFIEVLNALIEYERSNTILSMAMTDATIDNLKEYIKERRTNA